jgi:NADH-quinone oxidoreductase subunit C
VTPPGAHVVAPGEWRQAAASLTAEGFHLFDFLTAVDRGPSIDIVVRVMNPSTKAAAMVWTNVPSDAAELDSLSEQYLGATWCEREIGEMFGVNFIGLADRRPLLLRSRLGDPPLLKGSTLVARAVREWPGAAQATDDGRQGGNPSRRRQLPPGVPGDFLRDAGDSREQGVNEQSGGTG